MSDRLNTDVLIVGAGPTGLMAANQLARFGVSFLIIDSKSGPTVQSRAIVVTSRSLEIYEQMGLSDDVIHKGQRIDSFHFYTGGKERGKVFLGEMGKGMSDFNYLLAFEQSKNESLLYKKLTDQGRNVLWETTFEKLIQFDDRIQVAAKSKGKIIEISAQYMIACDGAGSPVRHALNMQFRGGTYENKFFVADTLLSWELPYNGLVISPGKKNFVAFFPMKGESNYRVLGTLPDEYNDDENIGFQQIQQTINETIGVPIAYKKINWFSVYRLHHRRVDRFDKGRVYLAGDAAHIHSPAGGQGMNTGLQDAYNLAWKLAFVLQEKAFSKILYTYNEERLPFAKWLLSFTDRGFNLMTSDNRFIAFIRTHFASRLIGLFLKNESLRHIGFRTVSQIGITYEGMSLAFTDTAQKLKFKAGDRVPYLPGVNTDGGNIYSLLKEPAFYLLHIHDFSLEKETETMIRNTVPLEFNIIDQPTTLWKKFGVKKELFIWIRPDNYILAINDDPLPDHFAEFLQSFFKKRSRSFDSKKES